MRFRGDGSSTIVPAVKTTAFVAAALGGLVMLGCAGPDEGAARSEAAAREDGVGTTRASRELAAVREEERAIEAPAARVAPPPRPVLIVHAIDATEGEDGRGAVIPATRAIAFDLDARRFPPRARDPVLRVGALAFTRYTHPSPGVLRFVAADVAALPAGAPVSVEYEGEPDARVVVESALVIP